MSCHLLREDTISWLSGTRWKFSTLMECLPRWRWYGEGRFIGCTNINEGSFKLQMRYYGPACQLARASQWTRFHQKSTERMTIFILDNNGNQETAIFWSCYFAPTCRHLIKLSEEQIERPYKQILQFCGSMEPTSICNSFQNKWIYF